MRYEYQREAIMNKVWGGVLVVTGFIACPCHLVLTLPLILGVLGGTGLGAFLSDNQGLVYGVATGYFIVGLAGGFYLWNRRISKSGQPSRLPSQENAVQIKKLRVRGTRAR